MEPVYQLGGKSGKTFSSFDERMKRSRHLALPLSPTGDEGWKKGDVPSTPIGGVGDASVIIASKIGTVDLLHLKQIRGEQQI